MMKDNQKLRQTLQSLHFFEEQDFEHLFKSKIQLWNSIKNHIKKSIKYAFDQDFQIQINKILAQLDQILQTKETQKIMKRRKEKYDNLAEILYSIINKYLQSYGEEQNNEDQFQLKQRILQSIFSSEILRGFTFSELNQIIEKKIKYLFPLNNHKTTDQQKQDLKACQQFKEFFAEAQIDFDVVDQLILNRIQKNPNNSLNSSTLSEITKSYDTLNSFQSSNESVTQNINIIEMLDRIDIDEAETQPQVPLSTNTQKTQSFSKKQRLVLFMTPSEEKPDFSSETLKIFKKQEQKQLDFIPVNKRNVQNEEIKTQQTIKKLPNHLNEQDQPQTVRNNIFINRMKERTQPIMNNVPQRENQNNLDVTISVNQTFLEDENMKQNDIRSKSIIDQYSSQIRFTKGNHKNQRQLQVKQIERNQLIPLIRLLQKITTKQIDKYSPFNQVIQKVEVYGSFQNKCGFINKSDININLTVPGLKESNLHSSFFNFRKLLDMYSKNGYLNQLNLRSVIYCQEHKELILSHINTESKIKDANVVDYIFLTINRKEFVLSSRFMKDVIYNNEEKSSDIAHLTNFIHLLFKKNSILDHKSIYHKWFTTTHHQRIKKQNSQSRFVSISVYSMQMMILFYLKETGKISRISYSKEDQKYNFELLNSFVTIFENFVGFLKFYSSEGDYKRLYANRFFIDVVERSVDQEAKIDQLTNNLHNYISSQDRGYLFGFIHPMIFELIDENNGQNGKKFVTFEILKGSDKEKLFFTRIDRMLDMVTRLRPNEHFDPKFLFDITDLQFY